MRSFFTSLLATTGVMAQQELTLPNNSDAETCWVLAYGRGVGVPISTCPDDKEKDGALCYPLCRDGYDGVGPVCW